MAKRVDYQNPNNNLDEVHERRKAEIRAWADADQKAADERRGLIPASVEIDDWDALDQEETPEQPVDNSGDNEPEDETNETVNTSDESESETSEPAKEEQSAAPAKKAVAKKAAAQPKEAPSKE